MNNFIDAFVEETSGTDSPEMFRRWAGIMAVSGALERKAHTYSRRSQMFPNCYVVLVGPPGVGKTVVVDVVRQLWKRLKHVHVASSNVTRASLIDELNAATRTTVRPQLLVPVTSFNALLVASNELQVFMSSYEGDFMGVLQDLYDCKDDFSEHKRTKDLHIHVKHPSLTFFAGTTPSYLNDLFGLAAWDQGFAARTIFVYSGEVNRGDIFIPGPAATYDDLAHDLKIINAIEGEYLWEAEAAVALTEWYKAKGPPEPTHPKLLHYQTRRHAHLIKLAMIAAAACSDELVVRLPHYQIALGWLLSTEVFMPDIFKASTGADGKVMEDAWHYLYTLWVKEKRPIIEARLVKFLSERAPVHSVGRLLEVMVKSNMVKERTEKEGKCYEPQGR